MPKARQPKHDLVVASMSLCELADPKLRELVIRTLWAHTSGYLVLVESGNPQGFALVQEARDVVLSIGRT